MQDQLVICPKCHNTRTADLKTPCDSCGASRTLFGYLYQHEFRTFFWAIVVILVVIFLAILLGIGFLAYQSYIMANGLGNSDGNSLGYIYFLYQILPGGSI